MLARRGRKTTRERDRERRFITKFMCSTETEMERERKSRRIHRWALISLEIAGDELRLLNSA